MDHKNRHPSQWGPLGCSCEIPTPQRLILQLCFLPSCKDGMSSLWSVTGWVALSWASHLPTLSFSQDLHLSSPVWLPLGTGQNALVPDMVDMSAAIAREAERGPGCGEWELGET